MKKGDKIFRVRIRSNSTHNRFASTYEVYESTIKSVVRYDGGPPQAILDLPSIGYDGDYDPPPIIGYLGSDYWLTEESASAAVEEMNRNLGEEHIALHPLCKISPCIYIYGGKEWGQLRSKNGKIYDLKNKTLK